MVKKLKRPGIRGFIHYEYSCVEAVRYIFWGDDALQTVGARGAMNGLGAHTAVVLCVDEKSQIQALERSAESQKSGRSVLGRPTHSPG
jgi:hypothetical protein